MAGGGGVVEEEEEAETDADLYRTWEKKAKFNIYWYYVDPSHVHLIPSTGSTQPQKNLTSSAPTPPLMS